MRMLNVTQKSPKSLDKSYRLSALTAGKLRLPQQQIYILFISMYIPYLPKEPSQPLWSVAVPS